MGSNRNFLFGVIAAVVVAGAIFFFAKPAHTPENGAPPPNPSFNFDPSLLLRDHSMTHGPADAKVTMVEFLDPECEACAAMHPIVKKLLAEFDGRIRLVTRYMPFHPHALYAASLLEEARESGKYDQALDLFFEHQHEWGGHGDPHPEKLAEYMEKIGIDKMRTEESYVVKKHGELVKMDEADGQKLGVDRTPTFFINGVMQPEIGYEPLKEAIEKALNN
jgi:protein-disulfide isomerase